MSEDQKDNITAPRVERIESILLKDAVLKQQIKSKKETPIKTRDNRVVHFHPESVKVVRAIHEDGKDAYTIGKADVLKIAGKLFNSSEAVPSPMAVAATTSDPNKPASAPKVNYAIPCLSLVSALDQIAEHETMKGHGERRKMIKKLLQEYSELSQTPV